MSLTQLELVGRLTDELESHQAQRAKLEAKGADADKLASTDAVIAETQVALDAAKEGLGEDALAQLDTMRQAKAAYDAAIAALELQFTPDTAEAASADGVAHDATVQTQEG